mgnify:CR=1 FL=1
MCQEVLQAKKVMDTQVINNQFLVSDFYLLSLTYPLSEPVPYPGQFINLSVDPFLLKRPFAVFDYQDQVLTLLYKKVGEGTQKMSQWEAGHKTSFLSPLGNAFLKPQPQSLKVLVGGGTGIASLYYYAKTYPNNTLLFIGVNTLKEAQVLKKLFKPLKVPVFIAVAQEKSPDFYHGFVTHYVAKEMANKSSYDLYACGPHGMFLSLNSLISQGSIAPQNTYLSLEARMGCGFGVCLGCAVQKKDSDSFFYVCKDGPIFNLNELCLDE